MSTRLSSVQIESFMKLARELNFSRAAESLHITQPALTKRIQSLEETLGQALFVRLHGGLELTESGRVLQRYGAMVEHQESELLGSLVGGGADGQALGGFFRIASFSSALRSVIMPALGVLLRANPPLACQIFKTEVNELHDWLTDGKVDFVVSLAECERMGVENMQIGVERNVLIESVRYQGREDCYIDHEPRDNFTEKFFLSQTGATVPKMLRAYFDDIYGLIDAVSEGIGRAVVPVHLVKPEHQVRGCPATGRLKYRWCCSSTSSRTTRACNVPLSTPSRANALACLHAIACSARVRTRALSPMMHLSRRIGGACADSRVSVIA